MARYHLSELALADLDQIWEFIARDNPAAARNTISRILDACDKLAEFPGMGASCADKTCDTHVRGRGRENSVEL